MQLQQGSIIKRRLRGWYTRYTWLLGVQWHMGIYVGQGQVIHFNGEWSSANAMVCKESLQQFANGERLFIHAAPKDNHHAAAVCARAERILSGHDHAFNNKYSFVFNNCEDFSVTCFRTRYA